MQSKVDCGICIINFQVEREAPACQWARCINPALSIMEKRALAREINIPKIEEIKISCRKRLEKEEFIER